MSVTKIAVAGGVAAVSALATLGFRRWGRGGVQGVDKCAHLHTPEAVVQAIVVSEPPVVIQEVLKDNPVKHIAATLRAVVDKKQGDCVDDALSDDAHFRATGQEPVTVVGKPARQKASLSDLPALMRRNGWQTGTAEPVEEGGLLQYTVSDLSGGNSPEVLPVITLDHTVDMSDEMLFWNTFIDKLAQRGVLDFASVASLIEHQKTLGKGYSAIHCSELGEGLGIVHVTKAGLNALFPMGDGTFRVVSNNKRFNGEAFVQVAAAKGFLNGRY